MFKTITLVLSVIGLGTINYCLLLCLGARANYMERKSKNKLAIDILRGLSFILFLLFGCIALSFKEAVQRRSQYWQAKM